MPHYNVLYLIIQTSDKPKLRDLKKKKNWPQLKKKKIGMAEFILKCIEKVLY